MVFRGGKDKAPLGIIGEVSDDGKAKTQELIDMTHRAFQDLVVCTRPILKKFMKKVGTGDVFLGTGALDVGLIDQIVTSDEYITKKLVQGARVLKLVKNRKARFPFGSNFDNYDTALEDRFPLSISTLISSACTSMVRLLGFGTQINPSNAFRQAA
jgi:ClpP class serine protease